MRSWGEELAGAGFTVSIPLLPGHGASWREVNSSTWEEWYGALEDAYADLVSRCDRVVAMGLSMGGALTLRLAARHPEIEGVVVVNPSLQGDWRALPLVPLLSRLVPVVPAFPSDVRRQVEYDASPWLPLLGLQSLCQLWPVVCSELSRIEQPVLVFRSAFDKIVSPASTKLLVEGVSGPVEEVVLPHSGHMGVLDWDAPHLFAESIRFTETVLSGEVFEPLPVPSIPEALEERIRLAAARELAEGLRERIMALELDRLSLLPQQVAARARASALGLAHGVRRHAGELSSRLVLPRLRPARVPVVPAPPRGTIQL